MPIKQFWVSLLCFLTEFPESQLPTDGSPAQRWNFLSLHMGAVNRNLYHCRASLKYLHPWSPNKHCPFHYNFVREKKTVAANSNSSTGANKFQG